MNNTSPSRAVGRFGFRARFGKIASMTNNLGSQVEMFEIDVEVIAKVLILRYRDNVTVKEISEILSSNADSRYWRTYWQVRDILKHFEKRSPIEFKMESADVHN